MAAKKEKKQSAWLARIGDRETAIAMARETAIAVLFWAAVQAAFAFKYGPSLLLHSLALAAGGFVLLRWKSRSAAIALMLYALLNAGLTLAINAGAPLPGGRNIALALMIAWTAIKAVEATFRLQGRFAYAPVAASMPQTAANASPTRQ